MTSYLTQPFSDMTGPMYDSLAQWQTDVDANTAAAAEAIATARTSMQASYETDVVKPWKTAQEGLIDSDKAAKLALIQAQANANDQNALIKQAVMIAVKTAIDLVIADKIDDRMRDIAKDQRDLADRQLKMGEELHARYVNKFAPIEDAAADFAKVDWETNRYKPQYALQQGRASLDAARAFGKAASKLNKKMSRYCTGANANMLRQVNTDWARMEVDLVNRAWRLEEAQMWRRDDLQWARLSNAIAFGQRLPSQAAADIANGVRSATAANAIQGQAMQGWYGALARGANGLFQFGYGALEQQRAGQFGQLPGMARGGAGSLGDSGFQQGVLDRSYNYSEASAPPAPGDGLMFDGVNNSIIPADSFTA